MQKNIDEAPEEKEAQDQLQREKAKAEAQAGSQVPPSGGIVWGFVVSLGGAVGYTALFEIFIHSISKRHRSFWKAPVRCIVLIYDVERAQQACLKHGSFPSTKASKAPDLLQCSPARNQCRRPTRMLQSCSVSRRCFRRRLGSLAAEGRGGCAGCPWFGYRVDAELTCWGSRGDEVGVWICRIWRIFMCSDFLTASDIRFPSNADISLLSSLFHVLCF